jgi:hypothetical protein
MDMGTFALDKNSKKINLNFQVKISFNPNEDLSAENFKVEVVNNTADNKEKTKSKSKGNSKQTPNVFTNMSHDEDETKNSLNPSSKLPWTDTVYPGMSKSKSMKKTSSIKSSSDDEFKIIGKADVSKQKLTKRNDFMVPDSNGSQFNQKCESEPYNYELKFNGDEPDLEQLSRNIKHYRENEQKYEYSSDEEKNGE